MDKRCLRAANVATIWSMIISLIVLVFFNGIFQHHPFSLILCFATMYGIGTHMGFCMGYTYKTVPFSLSLLILIAVNFAFIILPIILKREGSYGLNMSIFFNFAYCGHIGKGKTLYNHLEKENHTDDDYPEKK